jgi:hypothetical protein
MIAPKYYDRELEITMTLRGPLAAALLSEARRRKRRPVDVLADVVETIIQDDLFAAVLEN